MPSIPELEVPLPKLNVEGSSPLTRSKFTLQSQSVRVAKVNTGS